MRGPSQRQGRSLVCPSCPALKGQTMDELQALEAQQTIYSNFRISPKVIKPCVAHLIVHNPKNKMFNPNDYAFIIATELRRARQDRQKANMVLKAWNNRNNPALRLNELNGIISRAYRKPYSYGCHNVILQEYCLGNENCAYYKNLFARKGRHREADFYKYGWQKILTPTQIALYHGLVYIERLLSLKPGELIIGSYNFISPRVGVAKSHLTENFSQLQKLGLIKWQKGKPYKWRETASEIRRIIAIPKPKNDVKMRSL